MTFPFVLNGNDYLNGYDGIKNKSVNASPVPQPQPSVPRDLRQPVSFEVSLERSHSEHQDVQMAEVEGPNQNVTPPSDKIKDSNQTPLTQNMNASETTMASSQQRVNEVDNMMELDSAVDDLKRQLDQRNLIE